MTVYDELNFPRFGNVEILRRHETLVCREHGTAALIHPGTATVLGCARCNEWYPVHMDHFVRFESFNALVQKIEPRQLGGRP